jgi:hypothetical protein
MNISNKTQRPLSVPLPGGKKLRLGPGKTGQITPKAAQHPRVKKLIDDGELEILDGGRSNPGASGSSDKSSFVGQRRTPTGGVRQTGDR